MSVMESLFAPRKDHRGWSTPSEAARIFFLLIMIVTSIWSWNLADGNIVVFGCLVMLISTPVLSIGWWLISLVSNRYEPKFLIDAVGNVESK